MSAPQLLSARPSPTLLAFDTATEWCSVALARGDEVVEARELVGQRHSERVLPMAKALLEEAGVSLSALDAIAFGAGPGSFTGLRIACGVAQGLAYGLDRPVLAIGNLAALAWAAGAQNGPCRVAAAVDARMNEVYWAVYDVTDGDATEVSPPALSAATALPSLLAPLAPRLLAGNALDVFADALAPVAAARRLPQVQAGAEAIVRLARPAWARGEAVPPAQAMPAYVRDRVAQTIDERRAARAAAGVE